MHKTSTALLLCALGCAPGAGPAPPQSASHLTDDLGRTVRLAAPARRVLSLAPSNTELVFALGAGQRLVGRTAACDQPPGAAAVPSVGGLFPPNYERILATAPDLVLMIEGTEPLRDWLEAHGRPVMVLQPRTLEGIYASTERLGRALGREAAARRLVAAWRARADRLRARIPTGERPTVFYEVWSDPLSGAGPNTYIGDLIAQAGGRDVLDPALGDWPRIATEALVLADPEFILTPHAATLTALAAGARPGWAGLRAVRHHRVRLLADPDLLARPGPRALDGLAWLITALHPQRRP